MDAVTELSATGLTKTTALATWIDAAGAAFYLIYAGIVDDIAQASILASVGPGRQRVTLTALTPGADYFLWVKSVDDVANESGVAGSAAFSTFGNAGVPGVDCAGQIVDAAEAHLDSFMSSDFTRLPFSRQIEKNPENIKAGYAALIHEGDEGENNVLGSYCLTLQIGLVFFQRFVKKQTERELDQAIKDLHAWADRAAKDFMKSRLNLSFVVRISTPVFKEPQLYDEGTAVSIEAVFPVEYRQPLNS